MKLIRVVFSIVVTVIFFASSISGLAATKVKEIGRFSNNVEHEIIGYGLVVGLARTGDSARNRATIQSIANALSEFELNVGESEISSKNVAAVIVTARLSSVFEKGDRIDVKVSSMGDARSLSGGLLVMTPLKSASGELVAIAQGQVTVGGYSFESFDSLKQKNHPTVGVVNDGAVVAISADEQRFLQSKLIEYVLDEPNLENITNIYNEVRRNLPEVEVEIKHSGKLALFLPELKDTNVLFQTINQFQNLTIVPETSAKVVINERTGTVVAGGEVVISAVTISHENLKLEIDTEYQTSQPFFIGRGQESVKSIVVPDTNISVKGDAASAVEFKKSVTVFELVDTLRKVDVSTREIISLLQSIKKAGALHAKLIVE